MEVVGRGYGQRGPFGPDPCQLRSAVQAEPGVPGAAHGVFLLRSWEGRPGISSCFVRQLSYTADLKCCC